MGSSSGDERMPPASRIRAGREIRRLLREGERQRTPAADLFRAPSPTGRPRLGVVVSLFGHTAVERNRLRRRLREIARREWLAPAWEREEDTDLLIRARPRGYEVPFGELRRQLVQAFPGPCSES